MTPNNTARNNELSICKKTIREERMICWQVTIFCTGNQQMTRKTFGRLMVLSGLLTATFLSPFATANTPPAATAATAQKPLRLLSYNIRCGYCEPAGSANHWDTRKFLVAHQMKQIQADVIGLQEAELFQIDDLLAMLPEYASYGLGRDDGKRQGESTAVLYRKDQFELIHSQTFWLSPPPQQKSPQ